MTTYASAGQAFAAYLGRHSAAPPPERPDGALSPPEDPSLPHQIVIGQLGSDITVSCNCLGRRHTPGRQIIEFRHVFTTPEAVAVYRGWHEQNGITL